MENESVVIIIVAVIFLLMTLIINSFGILDFLGERYWGEGFGRLCSDEADCREECQNSRGLCEEYCNRNPSNELCGLVLGGKG